MPSRFEMVLMVLRKGMEEGMGRGREEEREGGGRGGGEKKGWV